MTPAIGLAFTILSRGRVNSNLAEGTLARQDVKLMHTHTERLIVRVLHHFRL